MRSCEGLRIIFQRDDGNGPALLQFFRASPKKSAL
jgi:hypothetical protein